MNLDQMLSLEGITDYNIWWYGAGIYNEYMNDEGLIAPTVKIAKSRANCEGRIYLIMSGESGKTCRYRFAIRLRETPDENIFTWERVPLQMDLYESRLVFYRESGFSFYNSAKTGTDFIVDEIWGKATERKLVPFSAYEEVDLSFEALKEMVNNHYPDYYKALSCVKGIYMIIDGNSGKLYVGSAYGPEGIWGRWSTYATTYHGGNEELIKLFNENGEEYFYRFKYLVLQVLPMNLSDKEVIEKESYFKKRFLTREFGLNNN